MQQYYNSAQIEDAICGEFIQFTKLTETKSYIPITCCVLEHIITTTNLTNHEKLYYLLADSLALISKSQDHHRSCALPGDTWATRLGCSRSLVFAMQQSLEKKGYFIINKDFDDIGRNKRNLITPTLPNEVFDYLTKEFSGRVGDHLPYNKLLECKRFYLDRTKLFIKLNYQLLLTITASLYLNPSQKIIWLGFYTRCYKNYMLEGQGVTNVSIDTYNNTSFSFISSYQELSQVYSYSSKHLSKSIKILEELGFIKTNHFYIRKKQKKYSDSATNTNTSFDTNYYETQERQDQSLWKITLSLPKTCVLELEKVKNREGVKLNDVECNSRVTTTDNPTNPTNISDLGLAENYLMLGNLKFNLDSEQVSLLESVIDNTDVEVIPSSLPSTYIDSVMEEIYTEGEVVNDVGDKLEKPKTLDKEISSDVYSSESYSDSPSYTYSNSHVFTHSSKDYSSKDSSSKTSFPQIPFFNKEEKGDEKSDENKKGIKSDPQIAESRLLLNKNLISKIKDLKSNLGAAPSVLFDKFLKRFKTDDFDKNEQNEVWKKKAEKEFNIYSELIREKLKQLPKDKADKARRFAYSLISQKIATGYASSLNKHDLAKQLIHHAASWKPTKLGSISREKEIDTALSVAWKAIASGTWKVPLELAKAEVLQHEFRWYKQKYLESGILSQEIKSLEADVNKLLGSWHNLTEKITSGGNTVNALAKTEEKRETAENSDLDMEVDIHSQTFDDKPFQEMEINLELKTLDFLSADFINSISPINNKTPLSKDYGPELGEDYSSNINITTNNANYHSGSDYTEIEHKRHDYRNFSLSHIPDSQKYLKVIPSVSSNSIKLETINNKEYFVTLKELEMNEYGEFVMTLTPICKDIFLELSSKAEMQLLTKSVKDLY